MPLLFKITVGANNTVVSSFFTSSFFSAEEMRLLKGSTSFFINGFKALLALMSTTSFVVEETPLSSSVGGDTFRPPQRVTSGCVELSGETLAEDLAVSAFSSLISKLVFGLDVVLLASPFSTAELRLDEVVVQIVLVDAVVVVNKEFRRSPD